MDAKEPVAGLSAASSSIRLSLCAKDARDLPPFRPVFTHQCFGEKEFIPGWRPSVKAEEKSRQIYQSWKEDGDGKIGGSNCVDGELHVSYQNCCIDQSKEASIDVHILLSPSCEKCQVEIQTEKYQPVNSNDGREPAPKKRKGVSFADPPEKETQMCIKDIVQNISLAVPPLESVVVNGTARIELVPFTVKETSREDPDFISDSGSLYLKKPIGKVLSTYHRKIKGGSSDDEEEAKFIITLADGHDPSVENYHSAIQPLARWYIETADDVDLSDDARGSWKVMYLFRNHNTSSLDEEKPLLSLAGYMTLLHVNSPFRKPKPGIIVRICQALVLPPYHRAGHGSTMLQNVHDYADTNDSPSSGMDIVEINVEDPAPAFVALRDTVDFRRFVQRSCTDCTYLGKDVTDREFFLPVPDDKLKEIANYLKITKRQCQIVHEIYKLCEVEKWKRRLTNNNNSNEIGVVEVDTNYRLMIKKSLRSLREEELGACEGGKDEQKALLGKWFDEAMVHYLRVLKSKSHIS